MFYLEHVRFGNKSGIPYIYFQDRNNRKLSTYQATDKIMNRIINYILDFSIFTLRLIGLLPFHSVRKLFYLLAGIKLGSGSVIHTGAQFFNLGGIEIGEGSIIGQNAFLDGRDKLIIGRFVDIASDVMIYNSEHDINSQDFKAITAPVEIGDYCFIGPRVIILPGVRIGKGAVVAAGAVVTKNVDEFKIVGGVPAVVIGVRALSNPSYKLGRARLFQ